MAQSARAHNKKCAKILKEIGFKQSASWSLDQTSVRRAFCSTNSCQASLGASPAAISGWAKGLAEWNSLVDEVRRLEEYCGQAKGERTGGDKAFGRTGPAWLCQVPDDDCLADLLPHESGFRSPCEFE